MKHPHAEVIKAWADGKTVQVRVPRMEWRDFTYNGNNYLSFDKNLEYRIKPEEVVEYTVVYRSGVPGSHFLKTIEGVVDFYSVHGKGHEGYLKRTTVDGKVVKMELIPKDQS